MNNKIKLLGLFLFVALCLHAQTRNEPYHVSAREKSEGFVPMFNGIDMSGWVGNLQDYVPRDGSIVCDPSHGGNGNLFTDREYSDFVMRFEFKLTPAANNGIGIRMPFPLAGRPAYDGIELQVLDDESTKYQNLKDHQYHGSVYGVISAKRGYLKPVDEWNYQEIIADGYHIKITLNGTVILDGNLEEASKNFTETIDELAHPGLSNKSGRIAFLGHGSEVAYRNLRIKELKKATYAHAQQFKIEVELNWVFFGYATLVNLSDNAVAWEGSIPKNTSSIPEKFTILAKEGNYALCLSDKNYQVVYLPICLTSDIDLGFIKWQGSILRIEDILNGKCCDIEKKGDTTKIILKKLRKYDMLTVLSDLNMPDFRTKQGSSHISSIEVDGAMLEKNILELVEYFKNMPAKNVKYIEQIPPSEHNSGGIIRIVTHAPAQVYRITGTILDSDISTATLIDLTDNTVVWWEVFGKSNNKLDNFAIEGNYVLHLQITKNNLEHIVNLPVKLDSDVNLGNIEWRD